MYSLLRADNIQGSTFRVIQTLRRQDGVGRWLSHMSTVGHVICQNMLKNGLNFVYVVFGRPLQVFHMAFLYFGVTNIFCINYGISDF